MAVETVKKKIDQKQFQAFTKEHIVDRTKPLTDTIPRNRVTLFVGSTKELSIKQKRQLLLKLIEK